ncbi:hypothetical protein HDU86_003168 [Geranomyces michiganensis]|nr:hypothetical protein HDU86_003168 [Geranomyces michiganensis]
MPLPSYHEPRAPGQTRGSVNNLYGYGGSSSNLPGGSSANLYQGQANSGWATGGGFGKSSARFDDPETAMDGQQQGLPPRRGSVLGVFSEGLKKSWTSLGNITSQAAAVMMGSSGLGRSNEDMSSSSSNPYRTHASQFDEEAGGDTDQRSYGTDGGEPATLPGGLLSRGPASQGATDQHLLPRKMRTYGTQGGDNRRGSSILPS